LLAVAIVSTTSLNALPANATSGAEPVAFNGAARAAAALTVLLLGAWMARAWLRGLTFDDAYMFYRYAVNISHGLGISWNPDGVPTYGMTSQLWVLFVLPLTAVPFSPGHLLQLASWLAGCAALATLAAAVTCHAKSLWLRSAPVAFAAVVLPLVANPIFAYHLTTGMDTMVSLWANAAVVFGILEYVTRPTLGRAFALGVLSFVAILARPDAGLCALGAPVLAWLTQANTRHRWRDLAGLSVLPAALAGAELVLCKAYFSVPFPLGFYAKSLHAYAGFQSTENAVQYAYMAALCALPFAAALGATLTRKQAPLALALLLPAAATVIYLLSVRQVMGFVGRYYIPLLPFLVVQSLLSVDRALIDGTRVARRVALGIGATLAIYVGLRPIELMAERSYQARVVSAPIPVPSLPILADDPLPIFGGKYAPVYPAAARLVAALPAGARVAASEVGYLGALAPQATIIDLVGLNDTRIGVRGFSMDDLLARAPDFIWLPDPAYTGLRAILLSDPRFFERYIVVASVFTSGVAIRRDSPIRHDVEAGLRKTWAELYPSWSIEDYTVPASYVPATGVAPRPSS
jgi:hypothetical protein